MVPVLEAVPNFSTGRDPAFLDRLVRSVEKTGAEVLDRSADPDHHRSVVTFVGPPHVVEEAAFVCARLARKHIDMTRHIGVHPRIGALDVLPFVPLSGLGMEEARHAAHRVGRRLAEELDIPVYFYAEASDPPGRGLAELRRGGFEALVALKGLDRLPDLPASSYPEKRVHPTAGATCVGARTLLLAWNVDVDGVSFHHVRELAAELREAGGGFQGLRVLGMQLPQQGRCQLAMNLEDVLNRDPWAVFRAVETRVQERGGRVVRTEIIGLIPDQLLNAAGVDRLRMGGGPHPPTLSTGLLGHLNRRASGVAERLAVALRGASAALPAAVSQEISGLTRDLIQERGAEKE